MEGRDWVAGTEVGQPVLEVADLRVQFPTPGGPFVAVDGVSFALGAGERLGLVGESGSGKSTIALALMRLIKPPAQDRRRPGPARRRRPARLPEEQMRQLRLAEIALVAQGAMNSLNPVMRVRDQMVDALRDHGVQLSKAELDARVAELLRSVGLRPTWPICSRTSSAAA